MENALQTIKEPGVICFDVLQDKDDPSHFTLLEVYQNQEARDKHLETSYFLAFKEIALETFAKNGYGHEFEAVHPEGEWKKA